MASKFMQIITRGYSKRSRRGIDLLRNPITNRGTAFGLKERQLLGIHGLLPPAVLNIDQQRQRILATLEKCPDDLARYVTLTSLQERNEKLFYKVVTSDVEYCMPLIYTPTVGLACQKYGSVFRRPRGLYITIHDKDYIDRIFANWPLENIKAICVTDGERILGLGDLGAYGMGIPVGKLSLYTALAGVQPSQCLPIHLDVGTNNPKLLSDYLYLGLRHKRVTGDRYDEFIDTFMKAVVNRYGPNTLIQFEDFANKNAFRFLEKYRHNYCTFNDDIQGTASVAVAGVIASMRITKTKISDNTYLFYGAGEASIGIAHLLAMAMVEEGTSKEEALGKIFMVDSKGLITKGRTAPVVGEKVDFLKDLPPTTNLLDIVKLVKPTAIIGAAAVPKTFTPEVLTEMGKMNQRPIVFALSNPTSQAECTAEEAYKYTEGRAVFASGSPFDKVSINGKTFYPGQGNNSYIFPGVALAVVCCGIRPIKDDVFLQAAQCLAEQVTPENLDEGRVYPPLSEIRNVSLKIATHVAQKAYRAGTANYYPEPEDKKEFIKRHIYHVDDYEVYVPEPYKFPDNLKF